MNVKHLRFCIKEVTVLVFSTDFSDQLIKYSPIVYPNTENFSGGAGRNRRDTISSKTTNYQQVSVILDSHFDLISNRITVDFK